MRSILAATALVAMPFVAFADESPLVGEEMAKTADNLSAALIYADWRGSCKALDPKIEEAKANGAFDDVDYAVLDYTARDADAFFASADAAGVGQAIRAHLESGVKTGQLLLIDADNQTVLNTIKNDTSAGRITAAVRAAKG
ncbi:MAG: hypothetical protein AAGJ32_01045 [Pseudomonadota bacterium]